MDSLVRVRRDYLADAVIVGSLDGINPYRPPSIHLSMKLVETASGTVPFEVSDGWDAADSQVRNDIHAYYERNIGKDDCRLGRTYSSSRPIITCASWPTRWSAA